MNANKKFSPIERRVLTNLRLFTGTAEHYSEADTLVFEGDRIVAVQSGPDGEAERRISEDCAGLTAIPGLMDAHVHLSLDPGLSRASDQINEPTLALRQAMEERLADMVRAGITTARDLGGGTGLELTLRGSINAGLIPGPRLLCAGQPVTSINGHCHFWGGAVPDTEAGLAHIEKQKQLGVDLIKIMATGGAMTPDSQPKDSQFSASDLTAFVDASAPLFVAAHCHGTEGIGFATQAGVHTIEHCSWVSQAGWGADYDADVVADIAQRGTWVSPTVHSRWGRNLARSSGGASSMTHRVQENLHAMHAAGVKFIASTDAGIPGIVHDDLPKALPAFAQMTGMSCAQVLHSATVNAAAAFGIEAQTGSITENRCADVVLLEGDPLKDLATVATPVQVFARGVPMLGKNT